MGGEQEQSAWLRRNIEDLRAELAKLPPGPRSAGKRAKLIAVLTAARVHSEPAPLSERQVTRS